VIHFFQKRPESSGRATSADADIDDADDLDWESRPDSTTVISDVWRSGRGGSAHLQQNDNDDDDFESSFA
jgi:hypothetical protein